MYVFIPLFPSLLFSSFILFYLFLSSFLLFSLLLFFFMPFVITLLSFSRHFSPLLLSLFDICFISVSLLLLYNGGGGIGVGLINTTASPCSAPLSPAPDINQRYFRGKRGGAGAESSGAEREKSDDVWKYTANPDPAGQSSSIIIRSPGGTSYSPPMVKREAMDLRLALSGQTRWRVCKWKTGGKVPAGPSGHKGEKNVLSPTAMCFS